MTARITVVGFRLHIMTSISVKQPSSKFFLLCNEKDVAVTVNY